MAIHPSSLPWWGWLLYGAGSGIVARIVFWIVGITKNGARAFAWWFVGMMAGFCSIISLVIGVVQFAKWAWH